MADTTIGPLTTSAQTVQFFEDVDVVIDSIARSLWSIALLGRLNREQTAGFHFAIDHLTTMRQKFKKEAETHRAAAKG
jgi:hypothetical protein